MPTISLYLKDEVLKKLDAKVAHQAAADRAEGARGRAVTTRSSYIENMIIEVVRVGHRQGVYHNLPEM